VSFRGSSVYSSCADSVSAAGIECSAAFLLRFFGFPRVFGTFQHWFFIFLSVLMIPVMLRLFCQVLLLVGLNVALCWLCIFISV
jgi:hypothetical protein